MRRRWPWAVLLVLAGIVGIVALQAAARTEPPPTTSPTEVATADRAATARVEQALTEVGAPWLAPLGDEVADGCFTESYLGQRHLPHEPIVDPHGPAGGVDGRSVAGQALGRDRTVRNGR